MVAEKGIRKSAPVSRWNDDLATFADSLVIHSQKPWAGQGVGPGDPACSQLRPERLLAGGLSGPGSLGAGRTEDQGCARGAGGQGF